MKQVAKKNLYLAKNFHALNQVGNAASEALSLNQTINRNSVRSAESGPVVQGEKKVKVTDSVEIEVEEETATPTPNPDPQPTPEKNDGAVQTGDNVSPMLYAGAAMTSAAVLALIQRKRRKG